MFLNHGTQEVISRSLKGLLRCSPYQRNKTVGRYWGAGHRSQLVYFSHHIFFYSTEHQSSADIWPVGTMHNEHSGGLEMEWELISSPIGGLLQHTQSFPDGV